MNGKYRSKIWKIKKKNNNKMEKTLMPNSIFKSMRKKSLKPQKKMKRMKRIKKVRMKKSLKAKNFKKKRRKNTIFSMCIRNTSLKKGAESPSR